MASSQVGVCIKKIRRHRSTPSRRRAGMFGQSACTQSESRRLTSSVRAVRRKRYDANASWPYSWATIHGRCPSTSLAFRSLFSMSCRTRADSVGVRPSSQADPWHGADACLLSLETRLRRKVPSQRHTQGKSYPLLLLSPRPAPLALSAILGVPAPNFTDSESSPYWAGLPRISAAAGQLR